MTKMKRRDRKDKMRKRKRTDWDKRGRGERRKGDDR